MTATRYHLVFAGRLQPDVSLEQARVAMQARFKLSDSQLDRLFSGVPVRVKRSVDAVTAERYQRAFLETGAIVERRRIGQRTAPPSAAGGANASEELTVSTLNDAPTTRVLQLLPPGTPVGEEPRNPNPPPPDTSRLSLASSENSGLEDCAPQPKQPPKMDLRRFELLPLDAGRRAAADEDAGEAAEPGR